MITLKFKCRLISDLILNQKAATEGNQESLDFIPGSNFLGIAAGELYSDGVLSSEEQLLVFHSGKVRFGDAHPSIGEIRSLHVPTSMYYPKLKKMSDICYIHHSIKEFDLLKSEQLKQCRSGFYCFEEKKGTKMEVTKSFAIKSAYDRDKRCSKDKQMFGYQSLDKDSVFYFEVNCDELSSKLCTKIRNSLVGKKRIGRSRTAQYGLVEILEENFNDVQSNPATSNLITIYADSRLIFLDENGNSTFQPTVNDLGLDGGKILWDKSQIRIFQYAPWNFKRQSRDTDRCGIEKGSVFVVETNSSPIASKYIGVYQNEGFGKVVYNPAFLNSTGENGRAALSLEESKSIFNSPKDSSKSLLPKNELLVFLLKQKEEEDNEKTIYKSVNDFVITNAERFNSETFASQWGSIRSIAMNYKTKSELSIELFDKTVQRNAKEIPFAYLTHGIAKDKWEDRERYKIFKEFFDKLTEKNAQLAIINLAAEMAKTCRRK